MILSKRIIFCALAMTAVVLPNAAPATSFFYVSSGVSLPIVRISLGSTFYPRPAYRVITPIVPYGTFKRLQRQAEAITLQRIAANQRGDLARSTTSLATQNRADVRPTQAPVVHEEKQFESFERTETPTVDLRPKNSNQ